MNEGRSGGRSGRFALPENGDEFAFGREQILDLFSARMHTSSVQ